MSQSPREYLISIRPTKKGLLVIGSIFMLLPILSDGLLLLFAPSLALKFSLTRFMLGNFLSIFILLVIYHIIYYFLAQTFDWWR